MDLTPPSMIPSPTLPQQKLSRSPTCDFDSGCPLEAAAASYPSPRLFDFHYDPPSPYRSFNFLADRRNAKKSLPPPDTMADPGWRYPDAAPAPFAAISSSSAGPNILSTDYDPFADYEPGLSPVQYAPGGGYLAASSGNCTATRTPSHVAHVDPTSTNSTSIRTSFGYGPHHMAQAVKMDMGSLCGPSLETPPYPIAGGLQAHYVPSMSSFQIASPQFVAESPVSSWKRQGCEISQPPASGQPPCELPATPSTATRSASLTRARRGSRKHTTKDDANFQCSVEGCGKFFSRSYNFRSHMETHDEQREYPFLCFVSGCNKKFVRKTDLQRHHQSVHKKERNHRCDFCGRLFARKDTLRRHMEDGCSKRFDIGTLDLRSENHNHNGMDPADRVGRSGFDRAASTTRTLPPMTASHTNSLVASRVPEMGKCAPMAG
ncbi:Transcription factor Sp5 [Tolypocladium ophioglossoides CBS 100239]|uniref:Transcription factor Sp5 n=1 Tax=Tolypocladium ophioglossoides (strain CBS 100239) TaxID=1163406 RepID=A0A0L0NEW6_TOLOC|nr:Transcription factor Sp5 [Tolypocladium ophioglossoides CBS 100239]